MRTLTLAAALLTLGACDVEPLPDRLTGIEPPRADFDVVIRGPGCVPGAGIYRYDAIVRPWRADYEFEWLALDGRTRRALGNGSSVLFALDAADAAQRLELAVTGPGHAQVHARKTVLVEATLPRTAAAVDDDDQRRNGCTGGEADVEP